MISTTSPLSPPTPTSIFDRLTRSGVQLPRRDELEAYLAEHPDLGSVVEDACSAVRDEFGPEAELSLQMYEDLEDRDRYLTLYVRQEKYERGILDRIETAANAFTTRLGTCSGHLLITTDFRRPRG